MLARDGDRNAFGVLVERYEPLALRVARRAVLDEDVARELVQEALLQAYLSLDRLREEERFRSWLYGIVLNLCRSWQRRRRPLAQSLDDLAGGVRLAGTSEVEADPSEISEARELREHIMEAIQSLSPANRSATLHFYYGQADVKETAATLGISVAAVKGRLHRSRAQLRAILGPLAAQAGFLDESREEERPMIKVTVADVVETKWRLGMCAVVLFDAEGRRILPVFMGEREATAIALGGRDVQMPRPLTHQFAASLLEAAGGTLEEVCVNELKDDTFFAVARIRVGDSTEDVDARPSDAIALATLTGCPIYVAEQVMVTAGSEVPDERAGEEPKGRGIDAIVTSQLESWEGPHDLIAHVFGAGEREAPAEG